MFILTMEQLTMCNVKGIERGELPPVIIHNTPINQVCSCKSLGVHVDNMFTWQAHADSLCSKIQDGWDVQYVFTTSSY